ncbi:TonB-dependent receptor [Lacibacter sediminis]|uniref:TonB-dependent receptor n=1 Tax=Lacibacter sediminis TaxID=2760713 RepID=A0A7G5XEV1_9BACT|nr:TonB-dependent receptor [Lacibacter sediminis]QNA44004.1 TonB-dependent receptor [Lacibacter sediminis]
MKKLLFLSVCFLLVAAVSAQTKTVDFTGSVINSIDKLGLQGANIFIPDLRRGTSADANGKFQFKDLPAGWHLVEISYSGFNSVILNIEFKSDIEEVFQLKPTVAEHNEVVVTGVSSATSLRKVTTPVVVMRKQELLQTGSTNIIEALTKKPGISQTSTGPAISKPVIRGLGYNRVVVINDGLRQEGQQWGDEHGIEVDEYSVQKAEILKGPASLMYGSDAIAGVVNFISNVPVAEGKLKANLFGNYQTNNRQRGFSGNVAGNKNGFLFNTYASFKDAADYKNAEDGYVFNSKFNERNAGAMLGLSKKWGYSHLVFSTFNQKLGLVEGERDNDGNFIKYGGSSFEAVATDDDFRSVVPSIPYQHITHDKIVSDNSLFIRGGKLNLNVGLQRNQRREYGNAEDPAEQELYFDLKTINYNVQYHLKQINDWKVSFGLSGMNQQNTNKGAEAIIPDYSLNDAGAFVFLQKKVKGFDFSGGVRFDNRTVNGKELLEGPDVKFNAFERNFSNLSASAGFTYEFPKTVLFRFNVARGFRAPNMAELSSNGAHEGTNRYEVGDNGLKSEISFQADAGIELNSEHLTLTASLFHNNIKNYIFFEKQSSVAGNDSIITIDGEDFYLFRFVQQDARLYGLELSLDIHPHPLDWLHFENSFSFVRGLLSERLEGNKNIPFIPAARVLSELRFELFHRQQKTVRNAYFKLELDHNFAQKNAFTTYNTETASSSFTLLNAGLGTEFQKNGKTIAGIYFVASNLADVAYQHHLNRLKYAGENPATGKTGVYNMGRNFSIKLNVPLEFNWK